MAQLLRSPREVKVLVARYLRDGEAWLSTGAGRECIRKPCYVRRDWFLAIIDPAYDHLDFSLANLPVDLVPHDLSSLEKQRADCIELWSSNPSST